MMLPGWVGHLFESPEPDDPPRAANKDVAAIVRFTAVGKVYPGPPPVTALHPTDLTVLPGDYVAVVGPSGSGKSTLLNLLGLLDRPTSGEFLLSGIDVSRLREAERAAIRGNRIGFVFQSFHLLPYRTAQENVSLSQLYNGADRAGRREASARALSEVGLDHRMSALPTTMSGGERQRVAIARALVNRPSLLLCDEPTGNLDSQTSEQLMSVLDNLHASGLTLVVITHDGEVAARAHRIWTIKDGILTETGTR